LDIRNLEKSLIEKGLNVGLNPKLLNIWLLTRCDKPFIYKQVVRHFLYFRI